MKKVLIGILLTLSVFVFAFDFQNGSFEVANDIWQNSKFEFPSCGISDIDMNASNVIILSNDGEVDIYGYDGVLKNCFSLWTMKNDGSAITPVNPHFSGMSIAKNGKIFIAYSTRSYVRKETKRGKVAYVDIGTIKKSQGITVFNTSGELISEFGNLSDPVDVKIFNSKVYAIDRMKNEVLIYSMDGRILQKFMMPIYQVDSPKMADVFLGKNEYYLVHHPESLAVSSDGIYVIGNDGVGKNFLYKFDSSGKVLKEIPVIGSKVFTFAGNLWISGENGGFMVCDKNLNEIGFVQKIQGTKIENGILTHHERDGKILVAVSGFLTDSTKSVRFFYWKKR